MYKKPKIKCSLPKWQSFAILYGMKSKRISDLLNLPVAEARRIIKKFFEKFPGTMGVKSR